MKKSVLAIIFSAVSLAGSAQMSPEVDGGGGAVNIAISNLANEGNSYFVSGEQNERNGRYEQAVDFFSKAAFEFNSSRQLSRYGSALMRLSDVHFMLDRFEDAEQVVLNVALKNYAKMGSKVGQMASYGQLGKIYLASDKLTQSLWFYTQQGILARQIGNSGAHIESVIGIANVKIKKNEFLMASKDLNRAEALAKASKNSRYSEKIKQARALIARYKAKT